MQNTLKSVERLEQILDNSIALPGGYRIGVDGLIGLIPGVGDLFTGGISMFLVYKAAQLQVSKYTITKMVFNIVIDTALGSIPLAGDVFDFAWKSNTKNAKLIREDVEKKTVKIEKNQKKQISEKSNRRK